MRPSQVQQRSSRRRCDVCGGRYISRGICEFAPVCPRSTARRRELNLDLAQLYWGSLHDIVAAYAHAVTWWMRGMPVPRLLPYRVVLIRIVNAQRRRGGLGMRPPPQP